MGGEDRRVAVAPHDDDRQVRGGEGGDEEGAPRPGEAEWRGIRGGMIETPAQTSRSRAPKLSDRPPGLPKED